MVIRKKIALVIHPIDRWGGAEFHMKAIADTFKNAPIFTAWYEKSIVERYFPKKRIVASYLQHLPLKKRFAKEMVPLLPAAYRSLDLSGYDTVLVLSDGFEKQIRVKPGTRLILNVMTPPRFLWLDSRSTKELKSLSFRIYKWLFERRLHERWRKDDLEAVDRADRVLATSTEVQERVAKIYSKYADIIYPPVDTQHMRFNPDLSSRKDWYLYFGRVETYKGVELLIRSFAAAGLKLKVAGTGADLPRMKKLVKELGAQSQIECLGFVSEELKQELFFNAKALINPVRDEDFGIVPVEALAAGCPVIGYKGGGMRDTLVEGVTGVFFTQFDQEGVLDAIKRLERIPISPEKCRKQAEQFSVSIFQNKMRTYINAVS